MLMFSDTFILSPFHFLNIVLRMEAEHNPACFILTIQFGKMLLNNTPKLCVEFIPNQYVSKQCLID